MTCVTAPMFGAEKPRLLMVESPLLTVEYLHKDGLTAISCHKLGVLHIRKSHDFVVCLKIGYPWVSQKPMASYIFLSLQKMRHLQPATPMALSSKNGPAATPSHHPCSEVIFHETIQRAIGVAP